jgi:hypothetical protein
MSRYTAISMGLWLSVASGVYAQQAPAPATAIPAANSNITVRGCVAPIERDGSMAAKAGATTTPDTISQESNNPNPTGVFMLLDATPAAPSGPLAKRTTYTLAGHESELAKLRGRRVEIMGVVVPTIGHGLPERTDVSADGALRVRVSSLKQIAGNCSSAKK